MWNPGRRRSTWLVAALLSMSGTGGATATEAAPRWAGVWQGTLGTSKVHVCLQAEDGARGAYYDEKHLTLIAIQVDEPRAGPDRVRLREPLPAPSSQPANRPAAEALWQLQLSRNGRVLSGTWRDARKDLPVNLSAVAWQAAGADVPACASDAFNRLREKPARLTTKDATVRGVSYRVLSLEFDGRYEAEIASFELLDDSPGAQRFNVARRRALRGEEHNVFECTRDVAGDVELGADYNSREEPKIITGRWVVVEQNVESSCGGAHPNADTIVTTWRLDTGKAVDVWSWFMASAASVKQHGQGADRYTTVAIGRPLRRLLRRAWVRSDEDCRDVGATADDWMAYPTDQGLGFLPNLPHVEQACAEQVVVPWARVLPLLNRSGLDAAASFRADVEHRPGR